MTHAHTQSLLILPKHNRSVIRETMSAVFCALLQHISDCWCFLKLQCVCVWPLRVIVLWFQGIKYTLTQWSLELLTNTSCSLTMAPWHTSHSILVCLKPTVHFLKVSKSLARVSQQTLLMPHMETFVFPFLFTFAFTCCLVRFSLTKLQQVVEFYCESLRGATQWFYCCRLPVPAVVILIRTVIKMATAASKGHPANLCLISAGLKKKMPVF